MNDEISFEYYNPASKDRYVVYITREDIISNMDHVLFEKLTEKVCRCEPIGETNVIDCRCDEYAEEFQMVNQK